MSMKKKIVMNILKKRYCFKIILLIFIILSQLIRELTKKHFRKVKKNIILACLIIFLAKMNKLKHKKIKLRMLKLTN